MPVAFCPLCRVPSGLPAVDGAQPAAAAGSGRAAGQRPVAADAAGGERRLHAAPGRTAQPLQRRRRPLRPEPQSCVPPASNLQLCSNSASICVAHSKSQYGPHQPVDAPGSASRHSSLMGLCALATRLVSFVAWNAWQNCKAAPSHYLIMRSGCTQHWPQQRRVETAVSTRRSTPGS